MPLRIVSYSIRRHAWLPAALARCINARTNDVCRQVWANRHGKSAILFDGDTRWTSHHKAVNAELAEADVIVVHDGWVAPHHEKLLRHKPVLTLAENWLNLNQGYFRQGLPGVVVGHHQATLPMFNGWTAVPLPLPLWESCYQPVQKSEPLTICYAPLLRRGWYPPSHRWHWYSKRYQATVRKVRKFASQSGVPLRIRNSLGDEGRQAVSAMQASHIVLDECVTGSYHRESLEGLAVGAVVVNGLGMRADIVRTFRECCAWDGPIPFCYAPWDSLTSTLAAIIEKGPSELLAEGLKNRRWMEEHWDFQKQWASFWTMPLLEAVAARRSTRFAAGGQQRNGQSCTQPKLSVIVVSHNEGAYLRRTVETLTRTLPLDGEVIVVDDRSTDGSASRLDDTYRRVVVVRSPHQLGVSSARNFGAAHARGQILVFCDAHVETPLQWYPPLLDLLQRPEVGALSPAINNLKRRSGKGACGGTWRWKDEASLTWKWLKRKGEEPYPVPLLCGCFIAMRRDTFEASGGFDAGMILYGVEDAELSLRLWTLGYECWVVPQVVVSHRFGSPDSNSPSKYKFQPVNFMHNQLRLAVVHFGPERLTRLLGQLMHGPQFSEAFSLLASGDAWQRRRSLQETRRFDADWFFTRFGLT